jgi:FixJ family two-component response regulator
MVPFLLVTGYGTVAMAVEAMKMGAITVIEKPFHHDLFINTVREMIAFELKRRDQLNRQSQVAERMQLLTVREREIAELVVAGNLTKQIANLLGISAKTVEVHRSRITKKLGVESVAQLVRVLLDAQAGHGEQ